MVVEEKSISSAAKKLNMTQPAISKLVMRIEKNYEATIFDRNKTPWELTTTGVIFKKALTNILNEHTNMLQQIDETIVNRRGSLNFATMAYEDRHLLPEFFINFYKEYPNFKINILLLDSKKMEQKLLDHKVDFAHVLLPIKSNTITSIFLKEYEIVVCIPNKFLIEKNIKIPKDNKVPEIDITLFKESPFILRHSQLGFRVYENYILERSNILPNKEKITEIPQYITGINLANEGIGINFILDDVRNHIEKYANVSFFKIKDIRPKQTLSIAYLKNRKLSTVEKDFLQLMQKNIVK